jgi:hypothetical protein
MSGQSLKWKPLKWWFISLIALAIAIWLSSSALPVLASPDDQAIFKLGSDLVIGESQTVQDAFAVGGDVTLQPHARVQGDIFAIGGDLQLQENTQVEGDAFVIGGRLIRAQSAVVNGSEFTALEQMRGVFDRFGVFGTLYLTNVVFWLVGFVMAATAGVLLLSLLPERIDAIAATLQHQPLASLLHAIGGLVAVSILTVLTVGSALGSIVIPLANLAVLLTGIFGGSAVCVWLGQRLQKRPFADRPQRFERHSGQHSSQHFGLGLVLLLIISLIPIAGGVLIGLVTLFGFGATLLSRYGTENISVQPVQMNLLDHSASKTDSASI